MASPPPRQGNLFDMPLGGGGSTPLEELPLLEHQLRQWQERLLSYQAPLFEGTVLEGALFEADSPTAQVDLFGSATDPQGSQTLNPLSLTPQHLQFWRWPEQQAPGAALYFVLDRPPHLKGHLLLYVGETGQADRRWKGDHDCKSYLAAYGEALQQVGLTAQLSIRFWNDAPGAVRPRRALEQALIRRWLPPFNKETRGRWATPFTAELA